MKTRLLLLQFVLLSLSVFAGEVIEVTSYPVEMIREGKTDIQVLATPPPGMEIERVVIFLRPIRSSPPPLESMFKAVKPSATNSVPAALKLELKPAPPVERKFLKHINLGEEPTFRFKDEFRPLLRISFKFGK
jgi:hypothetical protein